MATLTVPFVVRHRHQAQQHVRADVAPIPLAGARRTWVLVASLAAIFIDQSASSISSSTLPSIQGAFGLGPDQGSWVLTVETAPYYASILSSIWLVARFGRKPVLVASLLGYALFSLLCIVAPDATVLLVLRFLQGIAQGGLFTTATLVIFTSHEPRELPKVFLPFQAVSLGGAALGPLVGGSLVEWGYWTDAFAWSAVLSLVTAAIILWQLPHHGRYRRIAYDPIGFLLALAMFVPFQYLVNEGERRDWFNDPNVTLAAIAFVVLAAIFAYWQRSAGRHPFIDVRVLGNRNLVVGLAISAILNLAGYSTTLLIQYAQLDAGFSPTEAGIVVGVRIAGIALGVFATGALVIRGLTTPRTAFVVGTVAYLCGLFAVGNLMTSTEDLAAYLPLTIAVGLAQGVANQPLAPMIFGSVAAADLPMGLIFYKLAPQIGLSVGNALSQRMLDVVSAQRLSDLAGDVTLQNTAAAAFVQDGHASQLSSLVAGQAMTLAYGDVTRWLAVIGVAALVLVLFMRVAHRK